MDGVLATSTSASRREKGIFGIVALRGRQHERDPKQALNVRQQQ
jgi:hypothetical protein